MPEPRIRRLPLRFGLAVDAVATRGLIFTDQDGCSLVFPGGAYSMRRPMNSTRPSDLPNLHPTIGPMRIREPRF